MELPRHTTRDLAAAIALAAAVIGAACILWQWKGIPFGDLSRDPSNIFSYPFYIGSVSSLGAILWSATASLCLFSSFVLRRRGGDGARAASFLLCAGLVTTLLLFDDLFLFHEKMFPDVLGIPESMTFSTYAVIVLGFLVAFRGAILRTRYPVLLFAGAMLALSMTADTLTNLSADTSLKFLVEDGFKFTGIAAWFVYYARVCADEVIESGRAGPER